MIRKDITDEEYTKFAIFLESKCGIVLGSTKLYLVKSRLGSVATQFAFRSLSELLTALFLGHNQRLIVAVIEAMTTNETLWFRDTYPFSILQQDLLKQYAVLNRPIRIWCAACSSGQEAYSIAMSVAEFKKQYKGVLKHPVEIIATDISGAMIEASRCAQYDNLSLSRGLSQEMKNAYFETTTNGRMQVKTDILQSVQFTQLNLLDAYRHLGKFDMIFCRNVLIYFSEELKKQILQKFAAALQNDGSLFLGASESISKNCNNFKLQHCQHGLYYKKRPLK